MSIQEFYEKIEGDYKDVLLRLPTEDFVIRFVKRFPTDNTYNELISAIEANDATASFEAAHKLKGIAANMAFTKLYQVLFDLVEDLRGSTAPANPALVEDMKDRYKKVIDQIAIFESEG